jgi:hypothetical protein
MTVIDTLPSFLTPNSHLFEVEWPPCASQVSYKTVVLLTAAAKQNVDIDIMSSLLTYDALMWYIIMCRAGLLLQHSSPKLHLQNDM